MSIRTTNDEMSVARKAALVAAALLLAAVLVFVFQNSESVDVEWLGLTIGAPLFVIMILSGLAAVGIRDLVGWALRRRSRSAERRQANPSSNK